LDWQNAILTIDYFSVSENAMSITGELFVGAQRVATHETIYAKNPATGETLQPAFSAASATEIDRVCALAKVAFDQYRNLDSDTRARFLESIADHIMGLGDELLNRANAETGLPLARLTGERGRTVNQLRLFADELRKQGWQGIRIDPALPERKPLPRVDLRMRKVAVGPVVVFGASNFPLAFSVAGGDTASALAAGCPVIVKGHSSHLGTSELVAQAIAAAVKACNMPEGVFSLLNFNSHPLAASLVANPVVKAVGFTGSRNAGMSLFNTANARPDPIPVYAEMSSINPVVLMPNALAHRAEKIGADFVASLTMGVGQFCTNPGFLIAIDSPALDQFINAASTAVAATTPAVMLNAGIYQAYEKGVAQLQEQPGVAVVARGTQSTGTNCGRAAFFVVAADEVLKNEKLTHEVFGSSSLLVRCKDEAQLLSVLEKLEGQLTATVHLDAEDHAMASRLMPTLERKAGRILANGWPTGVEVSHAIVHGGPFPATSDGRSTSVGTLAIDRFLRPVCYQDMPEALLPASLKSTGFTALPHRFDGEYKSGK
jgi:alpha-ketoglutaric semialdehyde dehydrogenase